MISPHGCVVARQAPRKIHRRRAEERRIDTVVDVGRPQRDLPAAIALRRRERGEIARQHRRRRHDGDIGRRALTNRRALVAAEEKQPVGHDRTPSVPPN